MTSVTPNQIEPRPLALLTAAATAGVATPASGARMIGQSMSTRSGSRRSN